MTDFLPQKHLKVFITGGNSGIGEGLAQVYHRDGARVIIGGRNQQKLDQVAEGCPGMLTRVVDLANSDSIANCGAWLSREHPDLDVVINNAGIQNVLNLREPLSESDLSAEIEVNLKGLILITRAALPLLLKRPRAALINISSGLAFTPLAATPIYCATKAAVHSYCDTLRYQLRQTGVSVIEVAPPLVYTQLHREQNVDLKDGLSVDEFVRQTLEGLKRGDDLILVGRAKILYWASRLAPKWFFKFINSKDPR